MYVRTCRHQTVDLLLIPVFYYICVHTCCTCITGASIKKIKDCVKDNLPSWYSFDFLITICINAASPTFRSGHSRPSPHSFRSRRAEVSPAASLSGLATGSIGTSIPGCSGRSLRNKNTFHPNLPTDSSYPQSRLSLHARPPPLPRRPRRSLWSLWSHRTLLSLGTWLSRRPVLAGVTNRS